MLKPNQFFSGGTLKSWKWKQKMVPLQLTKQPLLTFYGRSK